MKQITYLLFLFISSLSFGQVVINEIDPDTPGTDAAEFVELLSTSANFSLDGYVVVFFNGSSDTSYAAYDLDGRTTDANGIFVLGNTGVNGVSITFPGDGLQNGADAVAIYQANASDFPNGTAAVSTNLIDAIVYGTNDSNDTGLLTALGESTQYNDASDTSIQLTDDQSDYIIAVPTPGVLNNTASPSITITSPNDGDNLDPVTTSVDINFTTENFDLTGGNVVEYTVNASAAQTATSSPITIAVTSGESYTVTLELKDTGGSLNPQVIETINFSVGSFTNVATVADLRAGTPGNYYTLTGEALLTYQQSFRNQKFIEDATGGILIDDDPGLITTIFNTGDGITGLTGQLNLFNGQLQLVPTEDPGAPSSTGNTITAQEVTLAQLTASPEDYESELVKVIEVSVDNSNSTTWDNGETYTLTQNTDNFTFRASFFNVDYIGQNVPTIPVNITGIITERSNDVGHHITARDSNDIEAATTDPVLTINAPGVDEIFAYATTEVNIEFTTENFDLSGSNFVEYIVNSGAAQTTTTSPITVNVMPGTSYTVSLELKDGMGSLNPQVLETITFSTEVAPPSLPIIEQFDYIIGEDLGNQILWDAQNTGDEILINDGNLSYEGLASNIGNSISFDGSGKDLDLQFTTVNSGKVYSSFLIRVTDRTNFTSAGYFTALRENGGAFGPRVFLDPTTNSDEFRIGIGNNRTTTVFSTEVYTTNTDIFIVSSYDITTGVANLWINPVAGDAEPTTTLTETDDTPLPNVSSFLVRQDSGSTTPFIIMDELKLGTSWESVTEATLSVADFNPQDRSFKFYPNPVKDGVIHFSSDSTENTEIKIFNILGKEMISKKLDGSSINVSNLSQGVYLAQIIVDGQKAATTKIIIR